MCGSDAVLKRSSVRAEVTPHHHILTRQPVSGWGGAGVGVGVEVGVGEGVCADQNVAESSSPFAQLLVLHGTQHSLSLFTIFGFFDIWLLDLDVYTFAGFVSDSRTTIPSLMH